MGNLRRRQLLRCDALGLAMAIRHTMMRSNDILTPSPPLDWRGQRYGRGSMIQGVLSRIGSIPDL
jgi:hypothetical protein